MTADRDGDLDRRSFGGVWMRKRVIGQESPRGEEWLDLENVGQVEVSSEDPDHPIELALVGGGQGWMASTPGEQVIRLLFDDPTPLRSIAVRFDEHARARTQEFVLRWSPDRGHSYRDIVRQQFNFSPPGTTRETEHYTLDIAGATVLELRVTPDVGGGPALASLSRLRLA
jgi:hypothetical protein